jgi:hypothetical protein
VDRSRRNRRNRVRAVIALLASALGTAALGTVSAQAPARAPALATASLCGKGFDSFWNVSSASSKFTIVRTGTWQVPGGGSRATATETDAMLFIKHARYNDKPLDVGEACSPWRVSLNSFVRPAVQDLSGQWSQPAGSGSPSQGTCHAHHLMRETAVTDPLTIDLGAVNNLGSPVFKNNARKVKLVVGIGLFLPGLTCQTPFGAAQFAFPVDAVKSNVVTLSAPMLKHDRNFTLRFSGSASHTEAWSNSPVPGSSEHFDVTWSGVLRFRAAGCQETFFTTGGFSRRCAG